MLTEYNQITIKDKSDGRKDLLFEINLPKMRRDLIKLTLAGVSSFIRIKDLYSICLMLVKSKQIEKLFPIIERKVKKYKRKFELVAQKDIKKGEKIQVIYEVDVPVIEKQNGDNIKKEE